LFIEKKSRSRGGVKRVRGEEKRGGGRAAEREEAGTGGERGGGKPQEEGEVSRRDEDLAKAADCCVP